MSFRRTIEALIPLLLLVGCSQPCEEFCEMDCEHQVTCSDGSHPTGDGLEKCTDACVEFVEKEGVESDEDCECTVGNECSDSPTSRFAEQYECKVTPPRLADRRA